MIEMEQELESSGNEVKLFKKLPLKAKKSLPIGKRLSNPFITTMKTAKAVEFEKLQNETSSDVKSPTDRTLFALNLVIRDFCENTTAHGFYNISRSASPLWIRLAWTLILIISSSYCCYSICLYIINYLSYEVVVNYQVISESPVELPTYTICNLYPFNLAGSQFAGTYVESVLAKNNITSKITVSNDEYAITKVKQAANIVKSTVTSDTNLTTAQLKSLGFTISDMMISCYFNQKLCNTSDWVWFYDNNLGSCFKFNSLYDENGTTLESKQTNMPGPENGLIMELFVGQPNKQDFYTLKRGAYVSIDERGKRPLTNGGGLTVQTGTSTSIAISRTKYSRLSQPYSSCRENVDTAFDSDSEFFKKTIELSKYYQKLCYQICLQELYIKPNCSCADPSIPLTSSDTSICNNSTTLDCVNTQRQQIENIKLDEVCGPYCPLECESTTYSTSTSSSVYPTDYYLSIIKTQTSLTSKFTQQDVQFVPAAKNNRKRRAAGDTNSTSDPPTLISNEDVTDSILLVNIYLNELEYTYIEENPAITTDTVLGVVGGQVGLCLGASILSFIEVVEAVIAMLTILINRTIGQKIQRNAAKRDASPESERKISKNKNIDLVVESV